MPSPACGAEPQLELTPFSRPRVERHRVPAVGDLDPVREAQVEVEPVDRRRRLDDDTSADLVAATRNAQSIQVGASPRGSLALLKLSRCRAALQARDYVTPDDVKAVAVPALAHRLTLRPELWVQRVSAEDVVRERLDTVATPAAEDLARA